MTPPLGSPIWQPGRPEDSGRRRVPDSEMPIAGSQRFRGGAKPRR